MPRIKTNLNHYLQLRLSADTVAEIDNAIGTVPDLCNFNRCGFIRHAIFFVLDSIARDTAGKSSPGECDR
jgi:hypothetical protein